MKLAEIISKKYNISKRLAKIYIRKSKTKYNNIVVRDDIDINENEINLISLNIETYSREINLKNFLIKAYDNIVFFYKPAFMHSQRHKLEDELTIEDIVKTYYPDFSLISRLDYETDGVISAIKSSISINFQEKKYLALVHNRLTDNCIIENEIEYKKRKRVKVLSNICNKKTRIEVIKLFNDKTLVRAKIDKAVRHQIRAHLSFIGHPIVGDKIYGINDNVKRLMLNCYFNKINKYSCYSNNLQNFYKLMKEFII
jgi:23S rRNA-/tRNA-specific pseudouridylate synthase